MRRAIKKITQVVSPPQAAPVAASAGAAASAPTSTTSVAACSAVAAVSGTASAPASGGASERATNATVDEVATKVKKAVNKTIDDVKMTPFLRQDHLLFERRILPGWLRPCHHRRSAHPDHPSLRPRYPVERRGWRFGVLGHLLRHDLRRLADRPGRPGAPCSSST